MSLISSSGFNGITDPDAARYITAVEAADGELLEGGVAFAISNFIVGCKLDGIWDAIKASCILAGARTLSGALVPLVGTAPTNPGNVFVEADYNRKTGLVGDGSTKYLNSNRNNNADPQDSKHVALYVSDKGNNNTVLASAGWSDQIGETALGWATAACSTINKASWGIRPILAYAEANTSLFGASRSASANLVTRLNGVNVSSTETSQTPFNGNIFIYRASNGAFYSTARLSFYSIGESLDLALLDTRVTQLMTDIGAAIP
jgi:hypothetical protein